jgi:hypothetical protein
MEIRLLLDHRNDLVAERTRTVNRLRWHLLQLSPELERSLKPGSLNQRRVLDRVDRRWRKLPAGAQVRVAREQVAQIRSLNRQTDDLHAEEQPQATLSPGTRYMARLSPVYVVLPGCGQRPVAPQGPL